MAKRSNEQHLMSITRILGDESIEPRHEAPPPRRSRKRTSPEDAFASATPTQAAILDHGCHPRPVMSKRPRERESSSMAHLFSRVESMESGLEAPPPKISQLYANPGETSVKLATTRLARHNHKRNTSQIVSQRSRKSHLMSMDQVLGDGPTERQLESSSSRVSSLELSPLGASPPELSLTEQSLSEEVPSGVPVVDEDACLTCKYDPYRNPRRIGSRVDEIKPPCDHKWPCFPCRGLMRDEGYLGEGGRPRPIACIYKTDMPRIGTGEVSGMSQPSRPSMTYVLIISWVEQDQIRFFKAMKALAPANGRLPKVPPSKQDILGKPPKTLCRGQMSNIQTRILHQHIRSGTGDSTGG